MIKRHCLTNVKSIEKNKGNDSISEKLLIKPNITKKY